MVPEITQSAICCGTTLSRPSWFNFLMMPRVIGASMLGSNVSFSKTSTATVRISSGRPVAWPTILYPQLWVERSVTRDSRKMIWILFKFNSSESPSVQARRGSFPRAIALLPIGYVQNPKISSGYNNRNANLTVTLQSVSTILFRCRN